MLLQIALRIAPFDLMNYTSDSEKGLILADIPNNCAGSSASLAQALHYGA